MRLEDCALNEHTLDDCKIDHSGDSKTIDPRTIVLLLSQTSFFLCRTPILSFSLTTVYIRIHVQPPESFYSPGKISTKTVRIDVFPVHPQQQNKSNQNKRRPSASIRAKANAHAERQRQCQHIYVRQNVQVHQARLSLNQQENSQILRQGCLPPLITTHYRLLPSEKTTDLVTPALLPAALQRETRLINRSKEAISTTATIHTNIAPTFTPAARPNPPKCPPDPPPLTPTTTSATPTTTLASKSSTTTTAAGPPPLLHQRNRI